MCEKSADRGRHTKMGFIARATVAHGTTYATREAIAAAQIVIDARRANAHARLAMFREQEAAGCNRKGGIEWCLRRSRYGEANETVRQMPTLL